MSLDTKIKELLSNLIDNKIVPGAVFGAIDKEGNMLTHVAKGAQNAETGEPMLVDTYFPIFSSTKAITSMAVLKGVEDGLLQLDKPIFEVLPEFVDKKVLNEDGTFENPKQPVTLRHLLSHTSGLVYPPILPQIKNWGKENDADTYYGRRKDINLPLGFHPGEKWMYGVGIDWAGVALERVTGKTLGQYCKDHIFDPLESNSTFKIPTTNISKMHVQNETGFHTLPGYPPSITTPEMEFGGAGLFATVEGYLKLLVPFINDGKGANGVQILKPETIQDLAFTSQTKHEPFNDMNEGEHHFGFTYLPETFAPMTHSLTFAINEKQLDNGRSANSGFWSGVANLYWSVDPSSGIATFLATQLLPYGNRNIVDAALAAEGLVYKHFNKD